MSQRDENTRSRLDSSASDISQSAQYTSSSRQFLPPSDIESDVGDEESDQQMINVIQFVVSISSIDYSRK